MMQFGHNDDGPLNTGRARGTLKGTGEETEDVVMETTGKTETVHTYGWYMRNMIRQAVIRGAVPIVLSPVPRDSWEGGKVNRVGQTYRKWAAETALSEGAFFIDLNERVARRYEETGAEKVHVELFTTKDHTHTSWAGAALNAASVVEGLRELKDCTLVKALLKKHGELKEPQFNPLGKIL
jgi:lysophospholipase L1-like esterase